VDVKPNSKIFCNSCGQYNDPDNACCSWCGLKFKDVEEDHSEDHSVDVFVIVNDGPILMDAELILKTLREENLSCASGIKWAGQNGNFSFFRTSEGDEIYYQHLSEELNRIRKDFLSGDFEILNTLALAGGHLACLDSQALTLIRFKYGDSMQLLENTNVSKLQDPFYVLNIRILHFRGSRKKTFNSSQAEFKGTAVDSKTNSGSEFVCPKCNADFPKQKLLDIHLKYCKGS